ncbi:MAG: PEP-CTERM sorting domain-containing protein [Planctomycetota bacterium]
MSYICKVLLVFLMLVPINAAQAEIVLGFSNDGGASFSTEFEMGSGDISTFQLYLLDTTDNADLRDHGLFSFGLIGALNDEAIGQVSNPMIAPVFDDQDDASFGNTIEWNAALDDNFDNPPTGDTILLGSFDFTALAGGTSDFLFRDSSTTFEDWVTINAEVLDDEIFGARPEHGFSVTVTSVPEPGSLILSLLGTGAFALRRNRHLVL